MSPEELFDYESEYWKALVSMREDINSSCGPLSIKKVVNSKVKEMATNLKTECLSVSNISNNLSQQAEYREIENLEHQYPTDSINSSVAAENTGVGITRNQYIPKSPQEPKNNIGNFKIQLVSSSKKRRHKTKDRKTRCSSIRNYCEMSKFFKNFCDLLDEMSYRENFEAEFNRMINDCLLDESQLKNELLNSILKRKGTTKEKGEMHKDLFKEWQKTTIEFDANFINFFIGILRNRSCPAYDSSVKIGSGLLKFTSDSKLGKYFNLAKNCIYIIKESNYKKYRDGCSKSLIYSKLGWIFNETVMNLIEDAIVRLETDFELKSLFHSARSTESIFGQRLLSHLDTAISVFEIFEANQNGDMLENAVRQKIDYRIEGLGSGRFKCLFRSASSKSDLLKGYKKFVTRMHTRCNIIDRVFLIFKKLCLNVLDRSIDGSQDFDLIFLIIYSLLDFEKVQVFQKAYYQRVKVQSCYLFGESERLIFD